MFQSQIFMHVTWNYLDKQEKAPAFVPARLALGCCEALPSQSVSTGPRGIPHSTNEIYLSKELDSESATFIQNFQYANVCLDFSLQ